MPEADAESKESVPGLSSADRLPGLLFEVLIWVIVQWCHDDIPRVMQGDNSGGSKNLPFTFPAHLAAGGPLLL